MINNFLESLKGIAQTIKYTALHFNYDIPLIEEKKIARYRIFFKYFKIFFNYYYLSSKKSKVPKDIISLRKKMSIAVAEEQQPVSSLHVTSTINKINSVSKLVGNKILDLSRKIKPLVNTDNQKLQVKIEIKKTSSNSSLIDFENDKMDTANGLDLCDNISQKSDTSKRSFDQKSTDKMAITEALVLENNNPSFSKNISNEDINLVYNPNLTRKQFLTRQEKLNYLYEYTKNSSTSFLFI